MGIINGIKTITGINSLNYEKEVYEKTIKDYNSRVETYNLAIKKVNEVSEKINAEKQKCVELVNLYGLIDKKNKKIDMERIEELIEENNFDMERISSGSVVASLIAGGLLSTGLYTGASIFGVASTGTAIATLSGAAATNATLAFLGGGALAAGGGGMIAGTAVLGVAAIAPAILLSFRNFSKAGEIRDERIRISNMVVDMDEKIEELEQIVPIQEKFLKNITKKKEAYNEKMKNVLLEANKITKEFTDELKKINRTKIISTNFEFKL